MVLSLRLAVNHQCSVHPVFQRVTYHRFFEKIQIYCFLILCGILPLLVTRDITTWKEWVIDMFSIHDSGENIFNVYSKVNIVQLTTFKQAEHERDILCSLMTSSMQPVTTAYRYMAETLTGGIASSIRGSSLSLSTEIITLNAWFCSLTHCIPATI